MSESIRFIVYGPPVPKGRPRVYKGHAITPQRTKIYESSVSSAASQAMLWDEPTTEPIEIKMRFYQHDRRKRDIDNLVKAILDGLEGVIYKNDHQVVSLEAVKLIDLDRPRAEIEIGIVCTQ